MTENKPKMECTDPEVGVLLMSYSLGTLSDADSERFELHLLNCSACQQEMEAASPSLNALSEVREQFVARAHQEDEDFESQYERLAQDAQLISPAMGPNRSGSWLEMLWEVVWGRKWIIGTAGAVVIAMLFVLREGPKLTEPSAVKDEGESKHYALKPPKAGMTSDTLAARILPMKVELYDTVTSDAQIQKEIAMPLKKSGVVIPVPLEASPPSETTIVPEGLADEPAMIAAEELIIESKESAAEFQIAQLDVVQKSASLEPRSGASQGLVDNRQIAEIALGKFDPDQYLRSNSIDEVEKPATEQAQIAKSPGFKTDPDGGLHFRGGRNSELKKANQIEDSIDASALLTTGIASLSKEDYAHASLSLAEAYKLEPRIDKRTEIGLLLARTHILTGQLEQARKQLQQVIEIESDSTRKAFIQSAITKLDSIKTATTMNPNPK